jgi:hypothetical protein
VRAPLVLIHSPLVGPGTWAAVADELSRGGVSFVVPDLGAAAQSGPYWKQHAESAARSVRQLPVRAQPLLIGHSGAGVLLPAVRAAADRPVAGYVFVDASLPNAREPRKGTGAFAQYLRAMHARGQRFPNWTDEDLRSIVPDPLRRAAVLRELRPQPAAFWDEVVPVFSGWPDAPCAYLRFSPNPSYDVPAADARERGWSFRELSGAHFHMLVDPVAVTDALLDIAAEIHSTGFDSPRS